MYLAQQEFSLLLAMRSFSGLPPSPGSGAATPPPSSWLLAPPLPLIRGVNWLATPLVLGRWGGEWVGTGGWGGGRDGDEWDTGRAAIALPSFYYQLVQE